MRMFGVVVAVLLFAPLWAQTGSCDGEVIFIENDQTPVDSVCFGSLDLGDIDNDGDLDLVFLDFGYGNNILINDGSGIFDCSGQVITGSFGGSAGGGWNTFVDIDSDGDLDLVWSGLEFGGVFISFNDGLGIFSDSVQILDLYVGGFALADLDADKDLDLAVALLGGVNRVYFNSGNEIFVDSGQVLGDSGGYSVALGDVDGDGDVDLIGVNQGTVPGTGSFQPNRVYFNDGSGSFSDSGQELGSSQSLDVTLGDVDNDGDLDFAVANQMGQPNRVYLNDGDGYFIDSGQELGSEYTLSMTFADLDGDADLDLVVGNYDVPSRIFLNDGNGIYNETGQPLPLGGFWRSPISGDIDLDGDADLVFIDWTEGELLIHFNVCQGTFIRGDCNTMDSIDIADGIFLLGYLFSGFDPSTCADACDANDDDDIDIGDPIFILASLFTGGDMPPAPFPDCGPDPTEDLLGCNSFGVCP